MASEDEDDYMNMVIEEPTQKETFTQKKRRELREAEARGRVPSKAERAAREAARREEALATSTLNPTNKGFQMMAKLGFKPGGVLGKPAANDSDTTNTTDFLKSRAEPLNLTLKENRGGIGLDTEKKRKLREEAEEAAKRIKHEEGSYRDRVREERELKRIEAQVHAAQKVAERLDGESESGATPDKEKEQGTGSSAKFNKEEGDSADPSQARDGADTPATKKKPIKLTSQINVLYRGLIRERERKDSDRQARHALQSSLPSSFFPKLRLPEYDDPTMDREDKKALDRELDSELDQNTSTLEIELEEDDEELDAFNALEPAERLRKLVLFLRETYRYCFWCKYAYETDLELEGCPGLTEEDHD
ncbi:D111/G-patch [Penicillium camemberti]|uniref:D111/G-patch n=1 Tax=Penicillium camemberti (strain FM 013) TaxID=1429867 RepID=A0A0G4PTR8_PENC3|nr:D111/G-patch [Penicillium camemberti]